MDIYADILGVLKHRPEGMLITRLSYAAGLPIDRLKLILDALAQLELLTLQVKGPPLQANLTERRFFHITQKGLEFLEAYGKIQSLLAPGNDSRPAPCSLNAFLR